MPSGGAILIAAALAASWFAGSAIVHAAKRTGHQIGCVVTTGHRCPKVIEQQKEK